MQRIEKLKALRHILGNEVFSKNDELIFYCKNPYGCNGTHHKPKLSINIETDFWHCWVCGWKGATLKQILYLNGKTEEAEKYSRSIENHLTKQIEIIEYETPHLPKEFKSLSLKPTTPYGNAALEYLYGRGITRSHILKYKLGYCENGEYRHRIIIPSFDKEGDLNFFVGRKYYENIGNPYKHGSFNKDIIFNEYLIDWNKPIILTEGPFDAMVANNNAIPLQGSELRDDSKLFYQIIQSRIPVYLALDVDARQKQLKLAELFYSYGITVYHVPVETAGVNDIGEMTEKQFQTTLKNSNIINSKIDLLRMKAAI